MIFNTVREAGGGWDVHRELTVAGLQGILVPQAAMGDWYRMCDELVEQNLMTDTEADLNLASGTDGSCRMDGLCTGAGACSGFWSLPGVTTIDRTGARLQNSTKLDGTNHCATE